jgi:hypothetical protein
MCGGPPRCDQFVLESGAAPCIPRNEDQHISAPSVLTVRLPQTPPAAGESSTTLSASPVSIPTFQPCRASEKSNPEPGSGWKQNIRQEPENIATLSPVDVATLGNPFQRCTSYRHLPRVCFCLPNLALIDDMPPPPHVDTEVFVNTFPIDDEGLHCMLPLFLSIRPLVARPSTRPQQESKEANHVFVNANP